jgi:hypothetical protein
MNNTDRILKIAKINFDSIYCEVEDFLSKKASLYTPKDDAFYIVTKKDSSHLYHVDVLFNNSIFCSECAESLVCEESTKTEDYITTESEFIYSVCINYNFRACGKCNVVFNYQYFINVDVIRYWTSLDYKTFDLSPENAWLLKTIFDSRENKKLSNHFEMIEYLNELTNLLQLLLKYLCKDLQM